MTAKFVDLKKISLRPQSDSEKLLISNLIKGLKEKEILAEFKEENLIFRIADKVYSEKVSK